ncbi:succinate-semialdehyde dehydrogenase/glutarate-semialdehyde dehydrogenase [Sphingomonas zeicaulis]|uniref:NAD-dependent succinate-semialdehyde dehydrogenase n=1 Tax=Sphingomonas zeicaulis TaxID=1632740 RepID=UPI003D1BC9BB
MYRSVNPATGETLATFDDADDAAVEAALAAGHRAFATWRRTSFADRRAALVRLAEQLEANADAHARLITLEMGKPVASARAEVLKCAANCRWYAEHGEALLTAESVAHPAGDAQVRHEPLGIVFAVMPWNFPYWQVVRFLAPALMAGNVVLLKHASSTPQCAAALADAGTAAGLPAGVFQNLFLTRAQLAGVIDDPRVAAVTLTGSEGAGISVGAASGRALKPCVLELGGSDPLIVMPSADIDKAVAGAVTGRYQNNGQSCVCAKRILVHRDIYATFREKFVAAVAALRIGDPLDTMTDLGPLSSAGARDELAGQVERVIAQGGMLVAGGAVIGGPGAYYAPTIIEGLPEGAAARVEEIFGPVALLFEVADLDDAIRLANETPFGLGSSVWTNDEEERARFADDLECGMTFFNANTVSDPVLPFGGIKRSGIGRELGRWGMMEFVNVRLVFAAA